MGHGAVDARCRDAIIGRYRDAIIGRCRDAIIGRCRDNDLAIRTDTVTALQHGGHDGDIGAARIEQGMRLT